MLSCVALSCVIVCCALRVYVCVCVRIVSMCMWRMHVFPHVDNVDVRAMAGASASTTFCLSTDCSFVKQQKQSIAFCFHRMLTFSLRDMQDPMFEYVRACYIKVML